MRTRLRRLVRRALPNHRRQPKARAGVERFATVNQEAAASLALHGDAAYAARLGELRRESWGSE